MNIESLGSRNRVGFVAAIATLLISACSPISTSSPVQLEANNPTVTYKYRNDDELIQTNQLAATFCSQYQLAPRPLSFTRDDAGNSIVNFECVPNAGSPATPSNPNLTYTYRSDQELLEISRNAHIYCLNNGSTSNTSSIVSNGNGTKTITFQCNPS
jgi:hypothetical protein